MNRKIAVICAALCACAAMIFAVLQVSRIRDRQDIGDELESLRDSVKTVQTTAGAPYEDTQKSAESSEPQETTEAPGTAEKVIVTEAVSETEPVETTPPETAEPYVPTESYLTLDFDALNQINPDIYAWIEIKDSKVDYPVLQSPTSDAKYLSTGFNNVPYIGGAIFTEASYNSRDFNDPVTTIYGHTMSSGTLFGQLESLYSDEQSFQENRRICIYQPDSVSVYRVFAAVPYENIHIMYNYDFSVQYWFENFFEGVRQIRALNANMDEEAFPVWGDKVIILSTCMKSDSSKRFLVMAVLENRE